MVDWARVAWNRFELVVRAIGLLARALSQANNSSAGRLEAGQALASRQALTGSAARRLAPQHPRAAEWARDCVGAQRLAGARHPIQVRARALARTDQVGLVWAERRTSAGLAAPQAPAGVAADTKGLQPGRDNGSEPSESAGSLAPPTAQATCASSRKFSPLW